MTIAAVRRIFCGRLGSSIEVEGQRLAGSWWGSIVTLHGRYSHTISCLVATHAPVAVVAASGQTLDEIIHDQLHRVHWASRRE